MIESMYQKGMSRKDATNKLLELLKNNDNKPLMIKNIKYGDEVLLSKNSIGKLVSETAVQKSVANGFTKGQHFAAASNIDDLFRDSVKILTLPDKYNNPDVKAIHRFVSPLFKNNAAFITIKEATQQGKRIYSVELIELGKLEGKVAEVKLNYTSNPATSNPISKYT